MVYCAPSTEMGRARLRGGGAPAPRTMALLDNAVRQDHATALLARASAEIAAALEQRSHRHGPDLPSAVPLALAADSSGGVDFLRTAFDLEILSEADGIVLAANEDHNLKKLRQTIINVLKAANDKGIRTLAFPPMGTGFYGVPLDVCARIMTETLGEYLGENTLINEVLICVQDTREEKPFQKYMTSRESA